MKFIVTTSAGVIVTLIVPGILTQGTAFVVGTARVTAIPCAAIITGASSFTNCVHLPTFLCLLSLPFLVFLLLDLASFLGQLTFITQFLRQITRGTTSHTLSIQQDVLRMDLFDFGEVGVRRFDVDVALRFRRGGRPPRMFLEETSAAYFGREVLFRRPSFPCGAGVVDTISICGGSRVRRGRMRYRFFGLVHGAAGVEEVTPIGIVSRRIPFPRWHRPEITAVGFPSMVSGGVLLGFVFVEIEFVSILRDGSSRRASGASRLGNGSRRVVDGMHHGRDENISTPSDRRFERVVSPVVVSISSRMLLRRTVLGDAIRCVALLLLVVLPVHETGSKAPRTIDDDVASA
mmetsp:Transcript_13421/g.28357  ORF Transcript_13421/g.28357 Transcript_13421/m.28357 type:complete len:347 (+) Transcript_13421:656-1696(+)